MKLMIVAIAGAFSAVAAAQTTAPAADNKAKQEMVKSATQAGTQAAGTKAAEGSAAAAKTKDMPKALPDAETKRKSMNSTSSAPPKGSGQAAADRSPRKEKPKPKLDSPEMKEASKP